MKRWGRGDGRKAGRRKVHPGGNDHFSFVRVVSFKIHEGPLCESYEKELEPWNWEWVRSKVHRVDSNTGESLRRERKIVYLPSFMKSNKIQIQKFFRWLFIAHGTFYRRENASYMNFPSTDFEAPGSPSNVVFFNILQVKIYNTVRAPRCVPSYPSVPRYPIWR